MSLSLYLYLYLSFSLHQFIKIPHSVPINPSLRIRIPIPKELKPIVGSIRDIIILKPWLPHDLEIMKPAPWHTAVTGPCNLPFLNHDRHTDDQTSRLKISCV